MASGKKSFLKFMRISASGLFIMFFVFTFFFPVRGNSDQTRSTAVIGFINSVSSDNETGVLLTRSFISFFSRLPGSKIIPYDVSDKSAEDNGFFINKNLDPGLAVQIGQKLGCRQVVFGSYKTDESRMTIEVDVFAYDTASDEILFKRHYRGKTGTALLDTIDAIRKDAAGILSGREMTIVELKITVTNTAQSYNVLLGGNPDGTAAPLYKRELPAGSPFDLSLKRTADGLEVFRTNIVLTRGKDSSIIYYPTAPVLIQSSVYPVEIRRDGLKTGIITTNETFSLSGLPSGLTYNFYLQNDTMQSLSRNVSLSEGKPSVLNFDERDFHPRVIYRGLTPAWDLLLPGSVQLQARDYWASLLFGGLWAVDIGILGVSLLGYFQADDIIRNDPRLYYRDQVKPYRDFYMYASIISGGVWLVISAGSWLHAEGMKTDQEKEKGTGLNIIPADGGLAFYWNF